MKRVLITRPQAQADMFGRAVQTAGMEPVYLPVIEISSPPDMTHIDDALRKLEDYDWLVLTSVNGVEAAWERLKILGIEGIPQKLRIAAIGPKTAAALQSYGEDPDFVPEEYIAEAILPGLGDLQGLKVLLLRADLARKALPDAIRRGGGTADEVTVYTTVPAEPDPSGLDALREGVDWITFTSPSTVENFTSIARSSGLDPFSLPGKPRFACIGPITAAAAKRFGYPVDVTADKYTTEGLLQAIQDKMIG